MRSLSFNAAILKNISKILAHRKDLKVSLHLEDMTASEWNIFKERSKRRASVLIPLLNYEDKASILFTQRTDQVSTHQNEISYPGGHVDRTDQSTVHSALREFHEELGTCFDFQFLNDAIIDQFQITDLDSCYFANSNHPSVNRLEVQVLGSLFEYVPSKYGTLVQPIVAFINVSTMHDTKTLDLIHDCLNPDPHEVQQVFCVPLDELTDPEYQIKEHVRMRGRECLRYRVPSSPCGDIWGLTGYFTQHLIEHVLLPSFRDQLS
eukprot:332106_1